MKDIVRLFHSIPNLYSLSQYVQRYVSLIFFLKFPAGVEMPISQFRQTPYPIIMTSANGHSTQLS